MTADLYCARADVARRLPPGALTSAAGLVFSSIASTDVLTYDGHGLETDDVVTVRTAGGSLSSPLAEGTNYYAIRLTNSTFSLASTAGGPAINMTTDGTSMVVMRDPDFNGIIEFYSRWADSFFPGHLVPFTAGSIPALVKGLVADLSAKRLLNINGQDSAILNGAELAAKAQLERFAGGMVVRDATATGSANKAITSTLASVADPRGWAPSGSGTLP